MNRRREALEELSRSLPSPPYGTIEDEARATLRLALGTHPASYAASIDGSKGCPNCGGPAASTKSPYCGAECREIAGFVRQVRGGLCEGTLVDPDRQVALGQVLWRILGGGLPFRNSLIEPKALARLSAKHEGKCAKCGQPATTVDHIGNHCNRTSNLRPVCADCAQTRPFGSFDILERPEVRARLVELTARIASPAPIRVCDDAETWDWRAYVAARKASS